MLQLTFTDNNGDKKCIDIDCERLSIGRDSSNDIVLEDDSVSGFHATVFNENNQVVIVDMGSSNGTFVNGKQITTRHELKAWDEFSIASVELQVVDSAGRKPTTIQAAVDILPSASAAEVNETDKTLLGTLVLLSGEGESRLEITDTLAVGRSSSNQLCLNSATVSSRHAVIEISAFGLEIVDLNSTNGTYVNGSKITRQLLQHGDLIRFDNVEYRLELPQGAVAKTQVNPAATAGDSSPTAQVATATVVPSAPTSVNASSAAVNAPPKLPPQGGGGGGVGSSAGQVSPPEQSGFKWLLLSLTGRIGRMQFIVAMLMLVIASAIANCLIQYTFYGVIGFNFHYPSYVTASIIVNVVTLWPSIALGVKRLHDQDRSGHWLWLMFVPLANVVLYCMILFVRGTEGANRYGLPSK